jgi:hypothetical protein
MLNPRFSAWLFCCTAIGIAAGPSLAVRSPGINKWDRSVHLPTTRSLLLNALRRRAASEGPPGACTNGGGRWRDWAVTRLEIQSRHARDLGELGITLA